MSEKVWAGDSARPGKTKELKAASGVPSGGMADSHSVPSLMLPETKWQSGVRTAYLLDSKPLKPEPQEVPTSDSEYMRRVRREEVAACPLFANGGRP
jgi:hypothetical protein